MKWFMLHNEISKGWRRIHILISILISIIVAIVLGEGLNFDAGNVFFFSIFTTFIYYVLLLSIVWIIRGFKEGDS